MIVYRATQKYDRKSVVIDRQGLTIRVERPRLRGGYYVSNAVCAPWPWRREK